MSLAYKDMSNQWWLLTANHHQVMFYGDGAQPTEHHIGNTTGVVDAKINNDGLWVKTQSGSVYLLDWNRHRINLANLIVDKAFFNSLGVHFPGDDFS